MLSYSLPRKKEKGIKVLENFLFIYIHSNMHAYCKYTLMFSEFQWGQVGGELGEGEFLPNAEAILPIPEKIQS